MNLMQLLPLSIDMWIINFLKILKSAKIKIENKGGKKNRAKKEAG